ncbi:hypothetical protein HDU86_003894 [Geranomyces michiganensis]|nr:hypothetical protein HDU86_003894 [Geranomyces michiganensis]
MSTTAGTLKPPATRPRFAPINPNDGGSVAESHPAVAKRRHSQTLDPPDAASLKRSLKSKRKKELKAARVPGTMGDAGVDSVSGTRTSNSAVDLGSSAPADTTSLTPADDAATERGPLEPGQNEAQPDEGKISASKAPHMIEGNVKRDFKTTQIGKKAGKDAKADAIPGKKIVNFTENGEQTVTTTSEAPISHPNSKAALNAKKASLQAQREALPCYEARQALVDAIMANRTTVIVGETGSGKTTQIPQFLYDAGLTKSGMIAITQPRRVAALSIAKRVAEEMGTRLGDKVGYSIRFDDTTAATTKIKYMTDGMLLRELLSDRKLSKYSVIILDEAHERTLRTDVLFGMVKGIQRERQDLKIIVMSATLNAERFSEYFDG